MPLGLSADLQFSQADRRENLRRAAEVARLFNDAGQITITAFLSPGAEDRAQAAEIVGEDRFIEVFCDAPVEVCKARAGTDEVKQIEGQIAAFSDMAAPYESPANAALVLKTNEATVEENVQKIVSLLSDRGLLG